MYDVLTHLMTMTGDFFSRRNRVHMEAPLSVEGGLVFFFKATKHCQKKKKTTTKKQNKKNYSW